MMTGYNENMNARQEQIQKTCKDYNIKILYVFGSCARPIWDFMQGEINAIEFGGSDADVAILTSTPLTISQKLEIIVALEDLFNAPRVDLAILNDADPFLAANAVRGERLYEEDSYYADEYDLFALRRAGDLALFERERMELALKGK